MARKDFNQRLENLISELEIDDPYIPITGEREPKGWVWECDRDGRFIYCSSEVEDLLGLAPESFLGQPLQEFALNSESQETLRSVIDDEAIPTEIFLRYQTSRGNLLPVSLNIMLPRNDGDNPGGLSGFVQVIGVAAGGLVNEIPETLDEPKTEEVTAIQEQAREKSRLPTQKALGDILINLLEEIRQSSPLIQEFPFSRVLVEDKVELVEDRSKKPTMIGSMAGKQIAIYPKKLVKGFEFKLEWGNKLDFTDQEKRFVELNKNSSPGILGKMQRRLAPAEILKCDMFWISIVLMVENEDSRFVKVSYPSSQAGSNKINLDQFVQEPELIQADLLLAIKDPWKNQVIFHAGEDYLIGN